jgi:hypothetical protein
MLTSAGTTLGVGEGAWEFQGWRRHALFKLSLLTRLLTSL